MAVPRIRLKYEGLGHLLLNLQAENLYSSPWRHFIDDTRDLVHARLLIRVPQGKTHALFDSIGSSADSARIPLWVRFQAGVERTHTSKAGKTSVFRYGWALQNSKRIRYRYRSGPRAGKLTRRWFSGALSGARREIDAMLDKTAREIERRWAAGGA